MPFLAICSCKGDTCTCKDFNPDPDQPNKDFSTVNNVLASNDPIMTKINAIMSGTAAVGPLNVKYNGATKFKMLSEYLLSCSEYDREKILRDIAASADKLPPRSLKQLVHELSKAVKANEARDSYQARQARRRALFASSIENKECDPAVDSALKLANGELPRLGFSLKAAAEDGIPVVQLDKEMRERGWGDDRRLRLKGALYNIGAIDA